jgi:hypothetical protein
MEYTIKEFLPNIFGVIIPDQYNLCMLFLRCQEYYESPNPQIRNHQFSIWDYIEWYSKDHGNRFTYTSDWSGFNLPFERMKECMSISEIETPYDKVMLEIIQKIDSLRDKSKLSYVIGVDSLSGNIVKHELCHGLYYINSDYKLECDAITNNLDNKIYEKFSKKLIKYGYDLSVIDDEIQAYLISNPDNLQTKGYGSEIKILEELHRQYNLIYEKYGFNFIR